MAKDIANILDFGGDDSDVYVGPLGTTVTLDLAEPPSAFDVLGWLTEGGVSFSRSEDRKVTRAHQGGKIVKRRTSSVDDKIKIQCMETNAVTHGLRWKGQSPTVTAGVAVTHVTNQTRSDDRAWIVDEYASDGSRERYIIPNGSYEVTGSVDYKNGEDKIVEIEIGINGDYWHVTDVAAVVGA